MPNVEGTSLFHCEKCDRPVEQRYAASIESVGWRCYDGGDPICYLCPACDAALRAVIVAWLGGAHPGASSKE